MMQLRVLTLWKSQFVLLVDDVARILEKLMEDSNCIQLMLLESVFLSFVLGCMVEDKLQHLCTDMWLMGTARWRCDYTKWLKAFSRCMVENKLQKFYSQMWQRVTARWRCDNMQRLLAFCETVQSSWSPEIFWASNGTGSFTIWHRWRCKATIALCATKEAEKLEPLTGLIEDRSVFVVACATLHTYLPQ